MSVLVEQFSSNLSNVTKVVKIYTNETLGEDQYLVTYQVTNSGGDVITSKSSIVNGTLQQVRENSSLWLSQYTQLNG